MSERVVYEVSEHVAVVTLNRPDKRNGLDLPMFEGLVAAGERAAKDPSVRAVVLQGAGKVFCAGLDWGAFLAAGDAAPKLLERPAGPANLAQRVGWIWQELEVPVVCALHGAAVGGGLQIALGADVRVAHPETQLSVMEIRYGLIPDMSATQTLLRLVRPDVAAELLYTGRTLTAAEGQALGLVTRLADDPQAAARALAAEIAKKSPHAIRAGKRLLRGAIGKDPKESFLLETELQLGLLGTPNQMEAVAAVMGKREPTFADVS